MHDIRDNVNIFLNYLSSLARNALVGTIPRQLGNLSNLKILNLEKNRLTGAVPYELGMLEKLTVLKLFGNEFSQAVPIFPKLVAFSEQQ